MSAEQHKLMGMRHMTIVPENYDPEAEAPEEPSISDDSSAADD